MRFSILIFLQFLSQIFANAQEVEAYTNIPDGYRITVEDIGLTSNSWLGGEEVTVRVHNAKDIKLIKVTCSGNKYNEDDIKLDFSDQNTIRYEDFNFDGKPDFGIYIHNGGNYGAHYFNIYLQENGKFIHHKEISELTLDLLEVDAKKERLISTYNSGVMIGNGVVEYSVENNNLQARKRMHRSIAYYPFAKFTNAEYDKDGNQAYESFEIKYYLNGGVDESSNALFEVEIMNDEDKKIILARDYETLYFGIVDKSSALVSLIYPVLQEKPSRSFKLETQENTTSLYFSISAMKYELRQIEKNGEIINLELLIIGNNGTRKCYGDINTIVGNINDILYENYINVEVEEAERQRKLEETKRRAMNKYQPKPGGRTTGGTTTKFSGPSLPFPSPGNRTTGGTTTCSSAYVSGRTVSRKPSPPTNPGVNGTVVIQICIDNRGNVISANYTQGGSTITDGGVISQAAANAKKWKFNTYAMVPDKQYGTIRYSYKK